MRILWIPVLWICFVGSLAAQADVVTALIIDGDDNIYLGSSTGLSRMASEGRQITRVLDRVHVHALAWSKRHGVFVGCNENEIWTSDGRRVLSLDEGVHIRCMTISGGQLWVGTTQGVYVISLSREEVADHFTPENSALPHMQVNTMYVDGSGIKWIGTDRGVVRIEGEKRWKVYEEQTRFLAIAGNVEGVWLAGDNEMWLVDPYNRWTPTAVEDGLSEGEIRSVATDKQGRIYLLSEIFVQFNPYTDEIVPIDDQTPATVAQNVALAIDDDDQLWVATRHEGLRNIDPEVELAEKPLVGTLVVSHPSCAGKSDGSIEIQVTGGRGPYQYYWSDPSVNTAKATGLAPGEYEILIVDVNGKEYGDIVVLEEPSVLTAGISEDVAAEGQTLVANASGGRGDFTYVWNSGEKTRRLSVEEAGTFTVTVTDANGCSTVASHIIEPVVAVDVAEVEERPETEPVIPLATTPEPVVQEEEDTIASVTVENLRELDARKLNIGQVLRIEQLQFKADSSTIQPQSFAILDGITDFLRNNENIVIEIGGHTNGLPDHDYCDRLSAERAKSVAEYLNGQGIPADRIAYRGYGKRQPIATNSTVEGRRKNQRVEVKILEL